jgi:SAM-dependent methyltransferase
MNSINELKKVWQEEYQRKGIPSSYRKDPTKTVVEFISWLKQKQPLVNGLAADIGCGQGRNSFYLASQGFQVLGIELLEENVKEVNAQAKLNHLPVQAFAQDAADSWPIESDSLNMAIDVFCYKHLVKKEKQLRYRQQLWRTLKPNGFYFISLASENDGFYGPLLKHSPNPQEKLILDPYSNIPSFLYSIKDLTREFSDLFEILQIQEQTSASPMYGKEYTRVVLNAVLRKINQNTLT